jgi:hypothetical protein
LPVGRHSLAGPHHRSSSWCLLRCCCVSLAALQVAGATTSLLRIARVFSADSSFRGAASVAVFALCCYESLASLASVTRTHLSAMLPPVAGFCALLVVAGVSPADSSFRGAASRCRLLRCACCRWRLSRGLIFPRCCLSLQSFALLLLSLHSRDFGGVFSWPATSCPWCTVLRFPPCPRRPAVGSCRVAHTIVRAMLWSFLALRGLPVAVSVDVVSDHMPSARTTTDHPSWPSVHTLQGVHVW